MEVIRPGTEVKLKHADIIGFITGAIIESDTSCIYEITYYTNGDLKSFRYQEYEFDLIGEVETISIGFK